MGRRHTNNHNNKNPIGYWDMSPLLSPCPLVPASTHAPIFQNNRVRREEATLLLTSLALFPGAGHPQGLTEVGKKSSSNVTVSRSHHLRVLPKWLPDHRGLRSPHRENV